MSKQQNGSEASTLDQAEIERFGAMAAEWWDPHGKFRPLHRLNPTRLAYIRDRLCRHFGRDPMALDSLMGLTVLDVGCGGGLLCEPLARLGAEVTGLDPAHAQVFEFHEVIQSMTRAFSAKARHLDSAKGCFGR